MKLLLAFAAFLILPSLSSGQSWTQHTPVSYSKAHDIFRDNRGILYAYGKGIGVETHISTNNGESWHRKSLRPGAFTAGRGDTLYFQTSDSIYLTTGGLDNFKNLALMPGEIFFHPSGTLFAHKKGEYLNRSLDGGRTWTELASLVNGRSGAELFAIDKQGRLLATLAGEFYVSSDLGDTWAYTSPFLTSGDRFQQLIVTTNNQYFLIAALTVQVSSDAGKSWTINQHSLAEWDGMRADSSGRILGYRDNRLLAYDNGAVETLLDTAAVMWITSDGRLWLREHTGRLGYYDHSAKAIKYSDNGFRNYDIKGAVRFADGEYYFLLDHGVHAFSKDLINWAILHDSWEFTREHGSIVDTRLAPDGSVFGISRTYGRTLYSSTTHGRTWAVFAVLPLSEDLVGIDSTGRIYTGARRIASDGSRERLELPTIDQEEFDINAQGKIVASTDGAMTISTDDGSTWTDIALNSWDRPYQVKLVDGERTLAATFSGLKWVDKDDAPWLTIDPQGDLDLYSVISDNVSTHLYAIGQNYGKPPAIYLLEPSSLEPELLVQVPPDVYPNHIIVHDGLLVAGSSDGIYSVRLPVDRLLAPSGSSGAQEVSFRDGKIKFASLGDAGVLTIYDALGRIAEAQLLSDGAREATVGQLAQGVYYFKLRTGDDEQVGKFLVRP